MVLQILWSLGQNVESAVYGHLGTSSLAAYTLTGPIHGLMVGALSGLSAAAGVMVGKKLGRKEYDEAYTESKKIMYAGLFGAVTVSALLILLAGVYTGLYCVDDSVKDLGKTLLIVFALYAPVKVENMILGGGIIRSGGNTKIIMIIDVVGTWCIGIPLCLLAAYVFKWEIVGVYTLLTTEELFRLAAPAAAFPPEAFPVSGASSGSHFQCRCRSPGSSSPYSDTSSGHRRPLHAQRLGSSPAHLQLLLPSNHFCKHRDISP